MREVLELLSYPFALRALAVGSMVSVCAAVLGAVLTLKRYALIGHGLSEVGFASLSVAAVLGLPPLLVSGPVVLLASFAILLVSRRRAGGDVAIAVASSAALALGVVATALGGGLTSDLYGYLFGSVLAITDWDAAVSILVSLLILISFLLFYNRLFLIACDEEYARSLGVRVGFCHGLLSVLTALTVVLGMRMMGTLLISSLIVLPAVTARRLTEGFRGLVIASALVSLICFLTGLFLSFLWDLPVGASVVLVNAAVLLAAWLWDRLRGTP